MNTGALEINPEGAEPATVRKQTKSKQLASQLRTQIVAKLPPESRLASYQELEQKFAVSRTVVREAITQLKREGFIQSVDRQGLYVSDSPPHLSRFGMAFADNPSSPEWPRFFTALQQEAACLHRASEGISFVNYYDVKRGPGTEGYERLRADVESHRLAGLMLLPPAHGLDRAEPFSSPSLPKVYICGEPEEGRMPSVTTCHVQMCQRMLQWLHERGRKRIAVVTMWGYHEELHDFLKARGVPHRPHWFQTVGRDNQAHVREVVALLMDYPPGQRPDGLMILDDNLTEHAVGGLLQGGLRVGEDIDVIAHCNWPWPVASPVPIQRIGFHAHHLVSLAVRAIQLARSAQPLAVQQVKISPLFESELNQPWEPVAFDR